MYHSIINTLKFYTIYRIKSFKMFIVVKVNNPINN